jgi:hypothetical protein
MSSPVASRLAIRSDRLIPICMLRSYRGTQASSVPWGKTNERWRRVRSCIPERPLDALMAAVVLSHQRHGGQDAVPVELEPSARVAARETRADDD